MTTNFMGLRYKEFIVTSTSGEGIELLSQTKADALYTAAELLNEPLENLSCLRPSEW
jgi:hypothetical protein